MNDDDELAAVIGRLRSGHDTLPFMTRLYPATRRCWRGRGITGDLIRAKNRSGSSSPAVMTRPNWWCIVPVQVICTWLRLPADGSVVEAALGYLKLLVRHFAGYAINEAIIFC